MNGKRLKVKTSIFFKILNQSQLNQFDFRIIEKWIINTYIYSIKLIFCCGPWKCTNKRNLQYIKYCILFFFCIFDDFIDFESKNVHSFSITLFFDKTWLCRNWIFQAKSLKILSISLFFMLFYCINLNIYKL